jgi:hypothetical protein
MAEKIEVRLNPEPALTETDEGGEMKYCVRRKITKRQAHQNKKVTEKGNGRQAETTNKVVLEDYYFSSIR